MAGLTDLPGEILLHILWFLEPPDLTALQLVSRGFHNLARDNAFWRLRCLLESSFLETIDRRRRFFRLAERDTRQQQAARVRLTLNPAAAHLGTSNNHHPAVGGGGGSPHGDDGDDWPRHATTTTTTATPSSSSVYTSADARERERVRIMANWDPCFPAERVSWYDEYIQRHGPVVVNWLQHAYDNNIINNDTTTEDEEGLALSSSSSPSAAAGPFVEARGVALYYPDGDDDPAGAVLAVAPLDDGSVCLWDVGGTKGNRGTIVARSRPGILFIDGPGADNRRRSKMIDSGVTECVSVDSRLHRAFFAVQSHLIEVDLRRLSVVDCESFPWSISALSAASPTIPLTVGTSLGIHLHDYRLHRASRDDRGESIDGFDRMGASEFYQRSLRHIFDDKPLPPYAPLSQPGPLSILHLQQPGQEAGLSDDIYVAGRFSNILHYDRRKFPSIRGSIHSGARLCSMTSLPYPFSTLGSQLRRMGELSLEQVEAYKAPDAGGRTLIACGEYSTKGSLELYGLTPAAHAVARPGGLQDSTLKNRQTSSRSKLLSVVNHGSRIAFSDGSGYIKWFERDGFTEVRRCRIGHSERSQGTPSIFASMPGSDDMARKLLPTRPGGAVVAAAAADDDGGGGGGAERVNCNDLLFWTGEKLGLVTFSARPGFVAEDFEEPVEAAEAEALAAESEYGERMRRALELQADDARFVRNLGLGSGVRPGAI
ncbi:hypothetical protein N658DRAFT_497098 [Parathielavia hyrcaniae]|uniref:F-box domain-containing protein n=1 Tax=Parathielavia hyrcaniae TaxID=113614 RepID=A0AAN6Q1N8_9PEZI|nr:hypothetical protein N658DRAFT_497098 [Parathielavia hyrcaniae]